MNDGGGRFALRHALFSMGYYGANAIYQGYMSLYYAHLGFSGVYLGGIGAATALAALGAQPIWGLLGDRTRSRRRLLGGLTLLAAATLPLALLREGFWFQLAAAMLFYAFYCALLPLNDAILLETRGAAFGAYRLAGGASFAAAGAIFGAFAHRLGPAGAIRVAALLLLLTALSARALPDAPGRQAGRRVSIAALFEDRALMRMLLFLLPVQMTMGFFYTFIEPHFQALPGSGEGLLGLGYLLSTLSEAPYLLLSSRIYRRFGAEKPMCLAALVLALRWLALGLAPTATVALASQLLHGGGFIVMSVSMARWISENVPPELRASGQGLLNMVGFGAARIAGNLLGGWIAGTLGRGAAFLAGSAVCVAALAAFAPGALRRGR